MSEEPSKQTAPAVNPADREKRLAVRAGLFLALGLLLSGIVVFVIGKERMLFEKQMQYTGAFENVDGLAIDSPVRLGGVTAGRVTKVSFAPDLGDKRVIVTMEVAQKFEARIRADSIARVTGRGVLGDKAIDISLGSSDQPVVKNGGELHTGTSGDISSLLKATGEIIDNAVGITRDLKSGVAAYTSPEIQKDVVAVVKSARSLFSEIETGNGAVHTLVYDREVGLAAKTILREASQSAARFDDAVQKVDSILGEIKTGNGSLHALLYDKKVANAVAEVGAAADELSQLVHDAKTSKEGAIYQLVYGDAKSMLADLGQASSDIKTLTGKIKSGQGSLGGLINDPTVYEDLKEVLGNVKRNRVLKELVRFSISNGENLGQIGKPAAEKSGAQVK
jgi:phospholipid/cholesterol/gamma-HCH transport system substrate-binding protein